MSHPVPSGQAPTPVDVGTAYQLWWGVAGFGLINMLASLFTLLGDRDHYATQLRQDMIERDPKAVLSEGTAKVVFIGSLGVAVVIGLVIAALVVLIAHRMRKGRNWARQTLTFIGVLLVFFAAPALFGLANRDGVGGWVSGAASVVEAVLAAGSIFLMHRKTSNTFFGRPPQAPAR